MKLGRSKKLLFAAAFLAGIGSFLPNFARVHAEDVDFLQVVSTHPTSSDTEVSVTESVYVYFNEPIQPGPSFSSIALGTDAGQSDTSTILRDNELIITPDQPLAYDATYLLSLPHDAVQSLSGASLEQPYSLSFTTISASLLTFAPTPAPNAVSVPVNQELSILFNQEIYEGRNFAGIELQREGPPQSVTASVYGNTLHLVPDPGLEPSVTYSVYLPQGAVESATHAENPAIYFQFTTEDATGPSAIDTYEPNDTPETAFAIDTGIAYSSYISHGADIDYYVIHATRNAELRFTLDVPQANRYRLYLYDEAGMLPTSGSDQISVAAQSGEDYLIRVSGDDETDYGIVPYTLTAFYRVDPPQALRIESHSGANAVLAWDPVDVQWGSVTYDLYQDGQWLLSTDQTTVQLQNLEGGATVQYTVRARNGVDLDSADSEAVSMLLFGDDIVPPSKPNLVLSAEDWTNQDVTATIVHGTDAYSGVWKSQYKIGDEGVWTDYADPILIQSEGETRLFARTIDNAGNIGEEESAVAKIDRTPPTAPAKLIKMLTGGSEITIGWSESEDNVGIIGYQIFNDGVLLGDTEDLRANLTGLLPSSVYRVTVRAFDAAGNYSNFSNELRMTTFQQPVYTYDTQGNGRLIRIQYENGTAITFQYDANGNLTQTSMQP
ncbi:Ig-like domain-containing protein [Cohnella cellulosilytica]|uniref:Ig-like domain-containing protein n=1 Tax=Cohnella cellulosilytica TaxID=986710 RepID=A0ABW2FFF2_9BACL